ncbi:MAG: response regulator [Limimaricola sp.]|nr:response regulator [Limimaricola sp.]
MRPPQSVRCQRGGNSGQVCFAGPSAMVHLTQTKARCFQMLLAKSRSALRSVLPRVFRLPSRVAIAYLVTASLAAIVLYAAGLGPANPTIDGPSGAQVLEISRSAANKIVADQIDLQDSVIREIHRLAVEGRSLNAITEWYQGIGALDVMQRPADGASHEAATANCRIAPSADLSTILAEMVTVDGLVVALVGASDAGGSFQLVTQRCFADGPLTAVRASSPAARLLGNTSHTGSEAPILAIVGGNGRIAAATAGADVLAGATLTDTLGLPSADRWTGDRNAHLTIGPFTGHFRVAIASLPAFPGVNLFVALPLTGSTPQTWLIVVSAIAAMMALVILLRLQRSSNEAVRRTSQLAPTAQNPDAALLALQQDMQRHELRSAAIGARGLIKLVRDAGDRSADQRRLDAALSALDQIVLVSGEGPSNTATWTERMGEAEPLAAGFDLCALLRDVVEVCRVEAASRGNAIELSIPTGPVPVNANRTHLWQIMANLIGNAAKYSRDDTIIVGLSAERPRAGKIDLRLRVTDHGPGIAIENRKQIFGYRARDAQSNPEMAPGQGLGLAITQDLVDAMKGRIVVEGGPGIGSTFVVHLSLPAASAADLPQRSVPPLDGMSVLIVDDRDVMLEIYSNQLEQAGAHVTTRCRAVDGLIAALRHRPDIILVDHGLDDLQLDVFCKAVRQDQAIQQAKVVVFSASMPEDKQRACLAAGADLALEKNSDLVGPLAELQSNREKRDARCT